MNVLELNDFDRAFFKAVGIEIPEESPWPLSDEKLSYEEALAVLGGAMKRKQRETDATGFAEPEAI